MNEFEYLGERKSIQHIKLQDAKSVVERGLRYFAGEDYVWLPSYNGIVKWLEDNERKGLMLFGGNSLGKTLISTRILPVIFKFYLKTECICVDAVSLSEYHKNPIDNIKLTMYSSPLITDDFGVEGIMNEYGEKHDLFSEIVDKSEKNGRLLVLTTNLTPDEIKERYGLRTIERLQAITKAVKVSGKSMRVKDKKQQK